MPDIKRIKLLQFCNEDKATSWQRSQAFQNLDIDFNLLFHSSINSLNTFFHRLIRSIFHRLKYPLDISGDNKAILDETSNSEFDVIFIEKCLTLRPQTLKRIKALKKSKLVCYVLDDFLGKGNQSMYFIKSIPFYDLIATNKEHNVKEYYQYGAKKVMYFRNAYSKIVHRPVNVTNEERIYFGSDIAFIGTYERKRAEYLVFLAENNFKIKIWGWSKSSGESGIDHPNITNMNKHVYFEEFSKVICSSKICLNFLRETNRDTETTRTMEIPACGGFMVSERTRQQVELFKEDFEAVYFG